MATLELATAGAAFGGPVGGAIGAAVGLGVDIFNFFSGSGAKRSAEAAQASYNEATMQVQLKQAQEGQTAYKDFLSKMPTAGQELKTSTGDLEFDSQYRQMLQQFGNINVLAGATGRVGVGTSMQAIGKDAEQQVSDLVANKTEQATRQLDIYNTTVETMGSALKAQQDAEYQRTHGGLFGQGGFLGLGI
jgi:hypothetical protein